MSDEDEFFDFDDDHEDQFHDAAESVCTSMPFVDRICLAATVADDHMPVSYSHMRLAGRTDNHPSTSYYTGIDAATQYPAHAYVSAFIDTYIYHRVSLVIQYVHEIVLMSCVQSQGCF